MSSIPGVTYRGAYNTAETITLCDKHTDRAPWPLGPVSKGLGVDPNGCQACAENQALAEYWQRQQEREP